jgi:phosphoribosylamine-glycine ligase
LHNGIVDALTVSEYRPSAPRKTWPLGNIKGIYEKASDRSRHTGNPSFRTFDTLAGIEEFLHSLESVVIKPDGLTGGRV